MSDQWWNPARQGGGAIPFRNRFDQARDPLTARNAIGAVGEAPADGQQYAREDGAWAVVTGGGGGGGAPTTAEYITASSDATLSAERVLTNTATVTWDFSTPGQAKATAAGSSGTPGGSNTQVQFNDSSAFGGDADLTWNKTTNVLTLTGRLTINAGDATSILAAGLVESAGFKQSGGQANLGPGTAGIVALRPNGIASATGQMLVSSTGAVTVNGNIELGHATDTTLSRVSAAVVAIEGQNILTAATGQPLDADLTAIAALTGTNNIYYRSAANTWTSVTIGTNMVFAAGVLSSSAAGGSPVVVTVQKFTATGTYTPTAGLRYCTIECVGGGGGGGGVGSTTTGPSTFGCGGGGAGAYSRVTVDAATIGASKAVTIGTAGSAGTGGGGNGGAGGATSVGTLCVANGGSGGLGSTGGTMGGGAGGNLTGAVGDITAAGAPGEAGGSGPSSESISGGNGGSSFFGGGALGPPPGTAASTVGAAGSNYGGGGSGAVSNNVATNRAGGAGALGFVIITEYL